MIFKVCRGPVEAIESSICGAGVHLNHCRAEVLDVAKRPELQEAPSSVRRLALRASTNQFTGHHHWLVVYQTMLLFHSWKTSNPSSETTAEGGYQNTNNDKTWHQMSGLEDTHHKLKRICKMKGWRSRVFCMMKGIQYNASRDYQVGCEDQICDYWCDELQAKSLMITVFMEANSVLSNIFEARVEANIANMISSRSLSASLHPKWRCQKHTHSVTASHDCQTAYSTSERSSLSAASTKP